MNKILNKFAKILRFISLILLTLIVTCSIPVLSVTTEISDQTIPINSHQSSIETGINFYRQQNFTKAIETWQQSLIEFKDDLLNQALILSYLSLAYQDLGRWDKASEKINLALSLLDNSHNIVNSETYQAILAKVLNSQGRLQYLQGDSQLALETWQKATITYQKINYLEGIVGSLINQSNALQSLGLNISAKQQLQIIYDQVLSRQPDSLITVKALQKLGQSLLKIGILTDNNEQKSALNILQEALAIAEKLNLSNEIDSLQLELGNTEKALANKYLAIGKNEESQQHQENAKKYYQNVKLPQGEIKAKLNLLNLLIETGQWSEIEAEIKNIEILINNLSTNHDNLFYQLNFAHSLSCLKQITSLNRENNHIDCLNNIYLEKLADFSDDQFSQSSYSYENIINLLFSIIKKAQAVNDTISQSYAYGELGRIYELNQNYEEAKQSTENALKVLIKPSTINANNIYFQSQNTHYRWLWQTGRILAKQGDHKNAIKSYREAVNSLKLIRKNLLAINSDVQFSFRDNVEPLYREFVDLLLTKNDNNQPSEENLKEALEGINDLQLAELENLLSCDLLLGQENLVQEVDQIKDEKALIVAPIILEKRLAIILKVTQSNNKDLFIYQETPINKKEFELSLKKIKQYLIEPDRMTEVKQEASKLYQWIIQPIKQDLQNNSQVETLVFVLDGLLRNIPMSVLYDQENKQYLIEKYAIAVVPQLTIFKPSLSSKILNIFTGGVGIENQIGESKLAEIKFLEDELTNINNPPNINISQPLINQNFTKENIKNILQFHNFSAIHWKTHGVFSADLDETFLAAYGEYIKIDDLSNLITISSQQKTQPLELLVLSACETAEGDNRAILGLAGIAIKTGAKSTLSTLWRANNQTKDNNASFMEIFYQNLAQGSTKANALQETQKSFIKGNFNQKNPNIWATYILVGNWL